MTNPLLWAFLNYTHWWFSLFSSFLTLSCNLQFSPCSSSHCRQVPSSCRFLISLRFCLSVFECLHRKIASTSLSSQFLCLWLVPYVLGQQQLYQDQATVLCQFDQWLVQRSNLESWAFTSALDCNFEVCLGLHPSRLILYRFSFYELS